MKILSAKVQSVSVACGIVFLSAVSSAIAQEPSTPTPKTPAPQSSPQSSSKAAPTTSPGATQNRPTTAAAPRNQFTSMDANTDGKISATEYRNTTMAAFLIMDKDRDGKVSALELTEAQPAASGAPSPFSSAQLSETDADKDSQLTSTEASDGAARMFKNLDINHNQFLSANELNGRQYRTDTEASADSRKTTTASRKM